MIDPVTIRFAASGVQDVARAFETVSQKIRRFEEQSTRAAREGSRTRLRAAKDEEKEKERAYQKLVRDIERQDKRRTREEEKGAKQREQAAIRATKAMADAAIREERRSAREVERLEQYKLRVRVRSAEMAGRAAAAEARQEEMAARRSAHSRAAAVAGALRGGGTLGRLGRGALGVMGATAGIGGGFLVADAMQERFRLQRTAALIVNAVTSGNSAPAGATVGNIAGQASQIARETGMSADEIAQGALTYSRNARGGDFAGVQQNMGFFTKLSQLSGSNINDLAEAAGTLQSQNADLTPDKMRALLMDAYAQSKKGSMSFSEAVKQIGIMGATRAYYSGNVSDVQRALIGFGQIARSGGTSEEAGTFVKNLAMEAGNADAKFFKAHHKHLIHFDKATGRMDSPEQMVEQVFRGTNGNINEIGHLFGIRGSILFGELGQTFRKASDAAGGGKKGLEAGIAAVRSTIQDVGGAHMTQQQFDAQHATVMSTPAAKFDVAIEKLKNLLADKLEPWLEKFADRLPDLTDKIGKVIDGLGDAISFFSAHPFAGLGAVVAAAVAKDIGEAIIKAAVGDAIKKSLESSVSSMGSGGKLSFSPQAVALTAAAVTIATVGKDVVQSALSGQTSGQYQAGVLQATLKNGTPAERQAAIKRIAAAHASVTGTGLLKSAAGAAMSYEMLPLDAIASMMGLKESGKSIVGGDDLSTRVHKFTEALEISKVQAFADALERSTKALDGRTVASNNTAPGAEPRHVNIAQRGVQ